MIIEIIDLLIITFISCFITLLATPFTIFLAHKYGLLDDPAKRPHPAHVQMRVVPRAGGLAMYIGLLLSAILFIVIDEKIAGMFMSLTILLIMGLLDDKLINFNPYTRLLLLFIATAITVFSGVTIGFVTNPLQSVSYLNNSWISPVLQLDAIGLQLSFLHWNHLFTIAEIVTFLWIITLTQIVNWSKGVDGQMPAITLMSALTLGILSMRFFYQGDIQQLEIAKLAFIVTGVSLGFLIFNWYPAKIFPGFSGSTILAFTLAVLAILSGAKLATAILVLAVPSADFIYTFFRRLLSCKSPVWGDRGHLHHRLLDLGWSHRQISLFYLFGSAILGLFALLIDVQSKAFVALGIIIVILGALLWLNSFGDLSKS